MGNSTPVSFVYYHNHLPKTLQRLSRLSAIPITGSQNISSWLFFNFDVGVSQPVTEEDNLVVWDVLLSMCCFHWLMNKEIALTC